MQFLINNISMVRRNQIQLLNLRRPLLLLSLLTLKSIKTEGKLNKDLGRDKFTKKVKRKGEYDLLVKEMIFYDRKYFL